MEPYCILQGYARRMLQMASQAVKLGRAKGKHAPCSFDLESPFKALHSLVRACIAYLPAFAKSAFFPLLHASCRVRCCIVIVKGEQGAM
jgi:hypothetical protein